MAPVTTLRPWKNGSNMDINELQEGSTLFMPIFVKGGLVWTGDSHCRQGNGEVNLTALECAYREIVHAAHRPQGHEARVAAHRDADPLDHDGLRRGPEQGDGQRGARDGGLSRGPADGPAEPRRGVLADVDGGRLPGDPGGRRPQGRALHGARSRSSPRSSRAARACAPRSRCVVAAAAGRRSRVGRRPALPS